MDAELAAFLTVLLAASVAYGRAIASTQTQITAWTIDALGIRPRRRGVTNLAVGVVLATMIAAMAAWKAGDLSLIPFGALAGVLSSVEAAKVHREQEAAAKGSG